jgi:hypothetical protein
MKLKWINLFTLYILIPVIIILASLKSGIGWYLFAIPVYYIGVIIAKFKQWIFMPIPLIFVFWYWYTYGLSVMDFVSIYFVAFVAGIVLCQLKKEYDKFVNKILPEQLNNLDYNEKVEELNRRIIKYRNDHPNEKLTPEIVEQIRTEVFFN